MAGRLANRAGATRTPSQEGARDTQELLSEGVTGALHPRPMSYLSCCLSGMAQGFQETRRHSGLTPDLFNPEGPARTLESGMRWGRYSFLPPGKPTTLQGQMLSRCGSRGRSRPQKDRHVSSK